MGSYISRHRFEPNSPEPSSIATRPGGNGSNTEPEHMPMCAVAPRPGVLGYPRHQVGMCLADPRMSIPSEAEVEGDLIRDRQRLPGCLQRWNESSRSKKQRTIRRLACSERRREEFEAQFQNDPDLVASWRTFPVTEQREILATIDYLRMWPRRWELRRAIEAVKRGSDYQRKVEP
jgi:hypothetical protein